MPRTAAVNQRLREAQRAKILDAARKVFVRQGRAMTIADIAAEAKVSQGLAYRYFANKEAIFHALIEQVIEAGNAVMLAPQEQHRRNHLGRIDHRQVGGHVEICTGRDRLAELQLGIGERFGDAWIGRAGLVPGEDAADHLAVALAAIVRAVIFDLLAALRQGR